MGLLDRFRNHIVIPRFTVGIFGKLPCYKEYFFASCHPVFSALRTRLDRDFEGLIRSGRARPYVSPDRRFFVAMDDPRTDLAGCIWDSHDGLRGFPFVMAAPIPRKLRQRPYPAFRQVLEGVWTYLEAYYADLEKQPGSRQVYNRVRGVVHQLDPVTPEPWTEPPDERARQARDALLRGRASIDLSELEPEDERNLIRTLNPPENPAYILWPGPAWREQRTGPVYARLGNRGLQDLDIHDFPPAPGPDDRQPTLSDEDVEVPPDTGTCGTPVPLARTGETPEEHQEDIPDDSAPDEEAREAPAATEPPEGSSSSAENTEAVEATAEEEPSDEEPDRHAAAPVSGSNGSGEKTIAETRTQAGEPASPGPEESGAGDPELGENLA